MEWLRELGLRPTRTRVALSNILFAKGDRHISAEMLFEEASKAKVPVSLATVYNTLISSPRLVSYDKSRSIPQSHILIPTTRSTTTIIWKIGTS